MTNATSCVAADACGMATDDGTGPSADAGTDDGDAGSAEVTGCLGPSCPRGECAGASGTSCDVYAGFDPGDNEELCAAATGSNQLCIKIETPRSDGFVEHEEFAVDCSEVTVARRLCNVSCGYNYSPYDCAVCAEQEPGQCAF